MDINVNFGKFALPRPPGAIEKFWLRHWTGYGGQVEYLRGQSAVEKHDGRRYRNGVAHDGVFILISFRRQRCTDGRSRRSRKRYRF